MTNQREAERQVGRKETMEQEGKSPALLRPASHGTPHQAPVLQMQIILLETQHIKDRRLMGSIQFIRSNHMKAII